MQSDDYKEVLEAYNKYTRECKKEKIKSISLKEFSERRSNIISEEFRYVIK